MCFISDQDFDRTAPVAAHWRALLSPLKFAGYHASDQSAWRQVVDERIPVMSYVSLSGAAHELGVTAGARHAQSRDLLLVKRGDWIRLCYADEAGSDELPYSPVFLQDFERDACYDRYFPSDATDSSVRYLIAGFHFAVVGAGEDFFDKILVHHFRRHYFQMGLILHMEFATLLSTSSRITQAVSQLAAGVREGGDRMQRAEREFRDKMINIERDFLQFEHLFHFTGLSNQIQPNELFQKWRCALGIDRIFADLEKEIGTATQFLLSIEQREETTASSRLTVIAAIGVVLGLAFSFLGMNVLIDTDLLGLKPIAEQNVVRGVTLVKHLALVFFVVSAFSGGGWLLIRWLQRDDPRTSLGRKTQTLLGQTSFWSAIAFVLSVFGVLFSS